MLRVVLSVCPAAGCESRGAYVIWKLIPRIEHWSVYRGQRPFVTVELAESMGFEPMVTRRPQRLSRPPHSSALATLRCRGYRRPSGSPAGPALESRRSEKNSWSSAAHSSARTIGTTPNSWLSRGSAPRL